MHLNLFDLKNKKKLTIKINNNKRQNGLKCKSKIKRIKLKEKRNEKN